MGKSQENQAESMSGSMLHPTAMVTSDHHGHQTLPTSYITDIPRPFTTTPDVSAWGIVTGTNKTLVWVQWSPAQTAIPCQLDDTLDQTLTATL